MATQFYLRGPSPHRTKQGYRTFRKSGFSAEMLGPDLLTVRVPEGHMGSFHSLCSQYGLRETTKVEEVAVAELKEVAAAKPEAAPRVVEPAKPTPEPKFLCRFHDKPLAFLTRQALVAHRKTTGELTNPGVIEQVSRSFEAQGTQKTLDYYHISGRTLHRMLPPVEGPVLMAGQRTVERPRPGVPTSSLLDELDSIISLMQEFREKVGRLEELRESLRKLL